MAEHEIRQLPRRCGAFKTTAIVIFLFLFITGLVCLVMFTSPKRLHKLQPVVEALDPYIEHVRSDKSASPLGNYALAAVSCDTKYCSDIAKDMLEKGGSVADAAIAALLCMGVVHGQSMGLGGGFLSVLYNSSSETAKVLNARETAPAAATRDMYHGQEELAKTGGLSVAVPGEMKGYWELHKAAGILPWKDLFQPAINLARDGFYASAHTAKALNSIAGFITSEPSLREVFVYNRTEKTFQEGQIIRRPTLAKTYELLADRGGDDLYTGLLAKDFVSDLKSIGGIITLDDMKNYRVKWETPIEVKVQGGFKLHTVKPPGSGVLLAFIMKVLSHYEFKPDTFNHRIATTKFYQRLTEVFKYAYARRTIMGDMFSRASEVEMQQLIKNLTSDVYTLDISNSIQDDNTESDAKYYGAEFYQPDDHGTAHISILAPNGDAISVTSTVNLYFGAKRRSQKTGIIYNDEMDDFSSPNITNYFGVPPSPHNFIEPGKRPLSSMSPAIFTDENGNVRLVLGAAGGTKITTAVSLVAMRNLWFGDTLKEAIDERRVHHQLYPMEFQYEDGFAQEYVEALEKIGHRTEKFNVGTSVVCAVGRTETGALCANSDFRKEGTIAGF